MKKKIGIIVFVLLVFICGFCINRCISYYTKKENVSSQDVAENDQYPFGSTVVIYIEQTLGQGDYIQKNQVPSDDSIYEVNDSTYCIGGGIIGYNNVTKRLSYLFDQADECYVYLDKVDAVLLTQQVSDDYLDDSTRAIQINYDSNNNVITSETPAYTEYRYIGSDPANYIYFNCDDNEVHDDSSWYASHCEKWRIIGSMDTNTTGVSGHLVKIIREISGFGINVGVKYFAWDYKKANVGSSTDDYGSSDWSDSQLMMMLNPTEYLNQGYRDGNLLTNRTYQVDDTTGKVYYISDGTTQNVMQNMGAYYNRTTGCEPSAVTSGEDFTCTTVNFSSTGLKESAKNYIQELYWKLGGIGEDNITGSVQELYKSERGTATYNETRPTTWKGKIGLMYASDYELATAGGSTTNRDTCLSSYTSWNIRTDCYNNDWLYTGSSTWTLIPIVDYVDAVYYSFDGIIDYNNSTNSAFAVRPVLYLKANTIVTGGTGSSSDPYQIMI